MLKGIYGPATIPISGHINREGKVVWMLMREESDT